MVWAGAGVLVGIQTVLKFGTVLVTKPRPPCGSPGLHPKWRPGNRLEPRRSPWLVVSV